MFTSRQINNSASGATSHQHRWTWLLAISTVTVWNGDTEVQTKTASREITLTRPWPLVFSYMSSIKRWPMPPSCTLMPPYATLEWHRMAHPVPVAVDWPFDLTGIVLPHTKWKLSTMIDCPPPPPPHWGGGGERAPRFGGLCPPPRFTAIFKCTFDSSL